MYKPLQLTANSTVGKGGPFIHVEDTTWASHSISKVRTDLHRYSIDKRNVR